MVAGAQTQSVSLYTTKSAASAVLPLQPPPAAVVVCTYIHNIPIKWINISFNGYEHSDLMSGGYTRGAVEERR